ncbi:glycosyltransferase family 2 protein [Fusobacterium mortiferum]|uniref:glycosyltransferase family 2 protein n=1 Tax=Fusobacterium mortiferum TaxID=850 RepID=UPI0035618B08
MRTNILLSIIIPCYNVEKFIKNTLNSILEENLEDYEIILINDGSVDNTLSIIQEYSRIYKFIKIITQKNQGVSEARNIGIKYSEGKYIYFLDGDDYLVKGELKKNLEILKETYEIIIFKNYIRYKNKLFSIKNNLKTGKYSRNEILENIFSKKILKCVIGNFIVKKELILKNNIEFERKYSYSEDYNFIIRCILRSKYLYFLNQEVFVYRRHEKSAMFKKINLTRLDSIKAIYDLEKIILLEKNNRLSNSYYYFFNMALIGNINELIRKKSKYKDVKIYLRYLEEYKIKKLNLEYMALNFQLVLYLIFFKLYSINKIILYFILKILIFLFKL